MSIDPSVQGAIHQAIADIESSRGVRVLFAAESGSRAWGFASPDSDYDVRFIYMHDVDWYLSIGESRDVIEAMLPGDLDLSGWDLRKTLRLFLRGNCALNEWIGSPIVYCARGGLREGLRRLLPTCFRAPAGYHHYLRMAQSVFTDHLAHEPVRLKKMFYVLRPLLACRWIAACGTQPPTEFDSLVHVPWVSDSECAMIEQLRIAKADAGEAHRVVLESETRAWFDRELARAEATAASIQNRADLHPGELDILFRQTLRLGGSSD